MTKPDEPNSETATPSAPEPAPAPTPASSTATPQAAVELESQTVEGDGDEGGVANIVRRWKREDLLKRSSLILRGIASVFSLMALFIMGANRHGDWQDYDRYEEYRYVVATSVLSALYTGFQVFKDLRQLYTAREMISRKNGEIIDFFGDQIVAYFLLSSASSAIPLTNRMRQGSDNMFTDSSASAISMEFFAFLCLGLSALISGFKLSHQNYI